MDKLVGYVEQHIGVLPGREAPAHFARYAQNLRYITYHANKATTWYVLYQQRANVFLIRHITNNHVAAQHFEQP